MSGRRGRVVGFGAVAVDQLVFVDSPLSAGKGRVVARETHHGGNVATGLAAVATLGGDASFVGYLPDPHQWTSVHDDLRSAGVDIADATAVLGQAPIRSTIVVTPAEERFIAFDDQVAIGAPPDLDLALVTGADAVLVDAYGAESGLRAVRAARAAGVPVVGDFERSHTPEVAELIAAVDHLVVPWGFAQEATGGSTPQAAVDGLWSPARSAVVVTDGPAGSWHRHAGSGEVVHVPAFTVEVVDTTGCGDIFHGAYAFVIARGGSVLDAVRFASAAAAIGATGRGGRGRLPREDAVAGLLRTGESWIVGTQPG